MVVPLARTVPADRASGAHPYLVLLRTVCSSVVFPVRPAVRGGTNVAEVHVHVPDGFLDVTDLGRHRSRGRGGVGVALRGARRELDDRTAPMAGLVAAFVFAAQMLNFPVGAGTSGHLLGGALAAVLVGPCTAALCLAVVLLVQGLLFADGGITALGTNITLFSIVAVGTGMVDLPAAPKRRCPSGSAWCRSSPRHRRARLGAGHRPRLRRALRRRRPGAGLARRRGQRDGRLARADRYRRGAHHRSGGQQRRRGATRPRPRRPRRARHPHPRGALRSRAPSLGEVSA